MKKQTKNQSFPNTRKKQFFNLLKNKFRLLTSIGSALLISSIPLLVTIFFDSSFMMSLFSNNEYFEGSSLNEFGNTLLLQNTLLFSSIRIICYVLLFITLGGALRVVRQLYWSEHVKLIKDLFKGIKNNLKNSIIFGLVFGLSRFIFNLIPLFNLNPLLSVLIYGVNYALIYPLILIGFVYTTLYNGSFFRTCYHSFLIYIKKFLWFLPFIIIFIAIPFVSYIPANKFYIEIVLLILMLFLIVPIYLLAYYGVSLKSFDELINHTYFKELENKGLSNDECN